MTPTPNPRSLPSASSPVQPEQIPPSAARSGAQSAGAGVEDVAPHDLILTGLLRKPPAEEPVRRQASLARAARLPGSPNTPQGVLRQQTQMAATLLLGASSIFSGLLGLVRTKYIAYVFGAGHVTDAYNAAFNLPEMINYFLVGGVASITLVNLLNRHREAGDDEGADHALSVVLNAMLVVLGSGILLAELFAPLYVNVFFHHLPAETRVLCTHLTRILLPAQLFFFAGGALGSRLLVRKVFTYQALTPILYNLGILLGGVLLSGRLGIDSLAWGVLGGAFVGSAVLNGWAVWRGGMRYTRIFNLRHPAFMEWLRLSLPLMIGVSLAMADRWILGYYATADNGGFTRMLNAKTLFGAPLTVIGAAAGAASLPFFSQLFAQGKLWEFNGAVDRAVSRLLAVSLLVAAWMVGLSGPIVGLLKGGVYSQADAVQTAHYLAIFAVSLPLWSAQGIYARAFYAARNTLTPAISGTVVTLVSIPLYGVLFQRFGLVGLAAASDCGILLHTASLAVLLHRFRLVSVADLDFQELGKSAVAALASWLAVVAAVPLLPALRGGLGGLIRLGLGSAVWAAVCLGVLLAMRSRLPRMILRRGKA